MYFSRRAAFAIILPAVAASAQADPAQMQLEADSDASTEIAPDEAKSLQSVDRADTGSAKPLPSGTPVIVSLDAELSTQTSLLGDSFAVTVVHDVMQDGITVIPKGTRGRGEITFVTKKGAFGKPGIIGIALRDLDLNGRQILLDGRFREEGGNNNGAAAATMFAVGVFAAVVKGKMAIIPAGRELKGRTGEDISIVNVPVPATPSAEPEIAQVEQSAPAPISDTPK